MGIDMDILYMAFKGNSNSSKVLLDYVASDNKLYLTNSFKTSVVELQKELKKNNYDLIVAFGQALLDRDTLKIEITAKNDSVYSTSFDYRFLYHKLKKEYKVMVSSDAGNYLCNHIYYHGLKYIKENNLKTKMIFIHIPKIEKITDIGRLSELFHM